MNANRAKLDGPRSAKSRVSVDEEYKHVSSQVKEHNARLVDALKLYLQTITLIVGGVIYLSIMPNGPKPERLQKFATVADGLVGFITFIAIVITFENLRAWFGYRNTLSALGGLDLKGNPHIPGPKLRSCVMEGIIILAMALAAIGFYFFNPLRIA